MLLSLLILKLEEANGLGDIRTVDHSNIHILTLTVDNNDDDGYTLNFQSENGITYGTGDNFGYLIHTSALDDTTATPNEGQKPTTRYELLLGESGVTTMGMYLDQIVTLSQIVRYLEKLQQNFRLQHKSGSDVNFNEVSRATRSAYLNLCLTQSSDIQLFHGDFMTPLLYQFLITN